MSEPDPLVAISLEYLSPYEHGMTDKEVGRGNQAHDELKAACKGRETADRKAALVLAAEVLRLRAIIDQAPNE